jgi:hypothetical protein
VLSEPPAHEPRQDRRFADGRIRRHERAADRRVDVRAVRRREGRQRGGSPRAVRPAGAVEQRPPTGPELVERSSGLVGSEGERSGERRFRVVLGEDVDEVRDPDETCRYAREDGCLDRRRRVDQER